MHFQEPEAIGVRQPAALGGPTWRPPPPRNHPMERVSCTAAIVHSQSVGGPPVDRLGQTRLSLPRLVVRVRQLCAVSIAQRFAGRNQRRPTLAIFVDSIVRTVWCAWGCGGRAWRRRGVNLDLNVSCVPICIGMIVVWGEGLGLLDVLVFVDRWCYVLFFLVFWSWSFY